MNAPPKGEYGYWGEYGSWHRSDGRRPEHGCGCGAKVTPSSPKASLAAVRRENGPYDRDRPLSTTGTTLGGAAIGGIAGGVLGGWKGLLVGGLLGGAGGYALGRLDDNSMHRYEYHH